MVSVSPNERKHLLQSGIGKAIMTVKSKRGRRRYTLFDIPRSADRTAVESVLKPVGSAKLITCSKGEAVVRSTPEDREAVSKVMADAFGSESHDCSGTLRALRERNPGLEKSGRRPHP